MLINDTISNYQPKLILNPYFVTGLAEAEGSFSINKKKDKRAKYDLNIGLSFRITMLNNEIELLTLVKQYFGCGCLFFDEGRGTVTFSVQDIKSINNIIIPHFTSYQLRGTKLLDFFSFKEVATYITLKKHLTQEGLNKIVEISKNMNSYRYFPVEYIPDINIENNPRYNSITGDYISGFIAGDGCLALNTKDKGFGRMSLQVSQHKHNINLLLSIAKFFDSIHKVYYHDVNSIQLTLSGIKLWEDRLFNHFTKYPLHGSKTIKLNKLIAIKDLIKDKNYLSKVGQYRVWNPEIKQKIINIWCN